MYTLDDFDERDLDVHAIEFLTADCGFSDTVAASIVLHALIKFQFLPLELIREAAFDLGYELPNLVPQLTPLKDRN